MSMPKTAPASAPPLAALRAFEAAARHQSFTRAASELGMTQAAVSYQIRLLEDRVGAPLFVRKPREVTLTPVGAKLAQSVRKALRALASAFAETIAATEGTLALTAAQSIAALWLAPRLGAFQAAHPDLDVKLETLDRLVDFASGEFDAGLRSGLGGWPDLVEHRLFGIRYTPVCSPALMAEHRFRKPADLLKARLLGGGDDPWWRRWLSEAGVGDSAAGPRASLTLGAQSLEVRAALNGHGVAMVMPIFFVEELAAGRLVKPFDLEARDERSVWLVYPQALKRQRKIRLLREWLFVEAAATRSEMGEDAAAPAPVTPPA